MRILITARKIPLSRSLEAFVRRRVAGALDRFAKNIGFISVELADRNGKRGGGDKRCKIRVSLTEHAPVLAEHVEASIHNAVRCAARHIKSQVHYSLKYAG